MIAFRNQRSAVWLAAIVLGGLLLMVLAAMAAGDSVDALPGVSLIRFAFGSLVAVGVLLLGARWLMRVNGAQGVAAAALNIVASLPVGQRERVVVVQVGGRQLMLGVAPGRIGLLCEIDEPLSLSPAEASTAGPTGGAWLARALGKNS